MQFSCLLLDRGTGVPASHDTLPALWLRKDAFFYEHWVPKSERSGVGSRDTRAGLRTESRGRRAIVPSVSVSKGEDGPCVRAGISERASLLLGISRNFLPQCCGGQWKGTAFRLGRTRLARVSLSKQLESQVNWDKVDKR